MCNRTALWIPNPFRSLQDPGILYHHWNYMIQSFIYICTYLNNQWSLKGQFTIMFMHGFLVGHFKKKCHEDFYYLHCILYYYFMIFPIIWYVFFYICFACIWMFLLSKQYFESFHFRRFHFEQHILSPTYSGSKSRFMKLPLMMPLLHLFYIFF